MALRVEPDVNPVAKPRASPEHVGAGLDKAEARGRGGSEEGDRDQAEPNLQTVASSKDRTAAGTPSPNSV